MCPKCHPLPFSFAKTDCSSLAALSRFIDRAVVVDYYYTAAANEAASDRTATALTFEIHEFRSPCWAQRLAPEVVPSEDRAGTAGKNVNSNSTPRILGYC